jgi:hypothetical protein
MRARRTPIEPIDTRAMTAHRASMAALSRVATPIPVRVLAAPSTEATEATDPTLSSAVVVDLAEARARREQRHSRVG